MTHNMGTADRILRALIVAPVLIAAGIAAGGWLGIVCFVLAVVMFGTALVGFCPLYPLVGLNTCKAQGTKAA
jgi:hypothetical protein